MKRKNYALVRSPSYYRGIINVYHVCMFFSYVTQHKSSTLAVFSNQVTVINQLWSIVVITLKSLLAESQKRGLSQRGDLPAWKRYRYSIYDIHSMLKFPPPTPWWLVNAWLVFTWSVVGICGILYTLAVLVGIPGCCIKLLAISYCVWSSWNSLPTSSAPG